MRTPRRLVAVDLDGTLLDRQGQPHASDVAALRELRRRGVAVALATGRLYGGVLGAVRAIGLEGPVACADGSHLVDAENGRDLLHHGFEAETLAGLRDHFAAGQVTGFVLARDRVLHDDRGAPFLDYVGVWSERMHRHEAAITDHPHWHADHVTALVGVGDQATITALHDTIVAAHGARVQSVAFRVTLPVKVAGLEQPWSMLVRAPGPSKGTAVAWLADHHGCTLDDVVVVGDWHNDVPMFKVAGRSFAMAQAPDDVKAVATDVLEASHASGGGIAEAARRAGLLP